MPKNVNTSFKIVGAHKIQKVYTKGYEEYIYITLLILEM
jgi:hypothetical protein